MYCEECKANLKNWNSYNCYILMSVCKFYTLKFQNIWNLRSKQSWNFQSSVQSFNAIAFMNREWFSQLVVRGTSMSDWKQWRGYVHYLSSIICFQNQSKFIKPIEVDSFRRYPYLLSTCSIPIVRIWRKNSWT